MRVIIVDFFRISISKNHFRLPQSVLKMEYKRLYYLQNRQKYMKTCSRVLSTSNVTTRTKSPNAISFPVAESSHYLPTYDCKSASKHEKQLIRVLNISSTTYLILYSLYS